MNVQELDSRIDQLRTLIHINIPRQDAAYREAIVKERAKEDPDQDVLEALDLGISNLEKDVERKRAEIKQLQERRPQAIAESTPRLAEIVREHEELARTHDSTECTVRLREAVSEIERSILRSQQSNSLLAELRYLEALGLTVPKVSPLPPPDSGAFENYPGIIRGLLAHYFNIHQYGSYGGSTWDEKRRQIEEPNRRAAQHETAARLKEEQNKPVTIGRW